MRIDLPSGGWWELEARPRWRQVREWMGASSGPDSQAGLADGVLVSLTTAWSFDMPIESASIESIAAEDVVVALRAVHRMLAALWDPRRQRELAERLFVEMAAGRTPDEFEEPRIMALTGWSWQALQDTPADVVEAMTTYLVVREARERGGEVEFPEAAHAR